MPNIIEAIMKTTIKAELSLLTSCIKFKIIKQDITRT